MPTYTFATWDSKRPVRRVAWTCGAEPALVAEVTAAYRAAIPAGGPVLAFGDMPEGRLWDTLLTAPPPGGRLAVVLGAGKLKAPGHLADLAGAPGLESAFTVFIDAAADFPRTGKGGRAPLVPELAALAASPSGQLIRCCAPGSSWQRHRVVASWWPGLSERQAADVLARCGGSLTMARHACAKACAAGLEPSAAAAAAVCLAPPQQGLADKLIAGDKAAAMAVAQELPRDGVIRELGLLRWQLDQLAGLSRDREGGGAGVSGYASQLLRRHARAYPAARIARCRRVLADAEAAFLGGAECTAEVLCAQW